MKKIFILLISLCLLCGCSEQVKEPVKEAGDSYVKSVWMTYYELEKFTDGNDERTFRKLIAECFNELSEMGFNTVTVQVRPCSDAFYKSSLFPSSKYCFGKQGAEMPYDPFLIICNTAKTYGLKVEAWLNPYRVSTDNKKEELFENNIALKWMNDKKKKSNVYISKSGIYFNPASEDVKKLIVDGVKEVVKNYDICAVHFDDYFYPTDKKDIDSKEYRKYVKNGGELPLSDWRRENVSDMVKRVYKAVKSVNKNVVFGISPAADVEYNRNKQFADVEKWIKEEGYVDYICPQVYFGFKNVYQPFMFTVKKWTYITDCSLYIGLPLYKTGKADKYASNDDKSIINEFKNNNDILARQITYVSKINKIRGIYVFSYSSLKDESIKEDVEAMLKALRNINQR